MSDTVTVLGGMFGDGMNACYANCDAFILPSFSEGVPMAVLHAWAFGKPVIMYDPKCAGSKAYMRLGDEILERHTE